MATHSGILAWRILWTEEPGRLHRVGHNCSDLARTPSLQEINTQDSGERSEKHKTCKTYRKQAVNGRSKSFIGNTLNGNIKAIKRQGMAERIFKKSPTRCLKKTHFRHKKRLKVDV